MTRTIRYTVSHPTEECQCPWCGTPLYIDDSAHQIAPDGAAGFCSPTCADKWEDWDLERIAQALARELRALVQDRACRTHGYDDCPACTGETLL